MPILKQNLKKISEYLYEIPKSFRSDMRVPARVYTSDEMLDEIVKDRSLEQLVNTSTLPGVVKYVLAMPDIHEGYGAPIGGVFATKVTDGIISPGAVGYDINCLHPKTKVHLGQGTYLPIEDLKKNWKDVTVLFANLKNLRIKESGLKYFLTRNIKKSLYQITTQTGHQVQVTADHPFWTPEGMKKAQKLKVGEKLAIYPFVGVQYEKPSGEIICTEDDVKALLLKIGKGRRGNALCQILNRLCEKKILPLTYQSKELPFLLKIMGYLFGDGTIYFSNSKGFIAFYGPLEDLKMILSDLKKIKVMGRIYKRQRKHILTNAYQKKYYFTRTEHFLRVSDTGLAVLLMVLGVPFGNKSCQSYLLPSWLWKAPLWQKRLFLSSFFGAELSAPATLNKYNFYQPTLNMSKKMSFKANAIDFLQGIRKLLSEFSVGSSPPVEVEGYQFLGKTGESIGLRLQIFENPQNLLSLFQKIGFEYSFYKQKKANLAIQYLSRIISERTKVSQKAFALYQNGLSPAAIFGGLTTPFANQRFLERSLWDKRKTAPRIAFNFFSFQEYTQESALGDVGMVWDGIEKIEKIPYQGPVYDLTINNRNHNFIANNFLVSNCGVRLLISTLSFQQLQPYLKNLVEALYQRIPSGVGKGGEIRLDEQNINQVLEKGAAWAVQKGYGQKEELEFLEEKGKIEKASASKVSPRAKARGRDQLGTVGSGNHFIEVQKVSQIFSESVAEVLGLFPDQITILIHSGSRGLGHQVATDYINLMQQAMIKYGIKLPDRELACAPFTSEEGQDYFLAQGGALNFAFANRQILAHLVRDIFEVILSGKIPSQNLKLQTVYDVAHNIGKIEEYNTDGEKEKLLVHRKGATRCLGPNSDVIPEIYRKIGQPVIIPGSMGTSSYVLVGAKKAEEESFGSTCFPGATQIITNKGIFSLREIYERFQLGEKFLVPSLDEDLKISWKPIIDTMKRKSGVYRYSVSQTGRSRSSFLEATPDHKFAILKKLKLDYKKVDEIAANKDTVALIDYLPDLGNIHNPKLAYLIGALITDGSIRLTDRHGIVIFIQKKTKTKERFIRYVRNAFEEIFGFPLRETETKTGGGVIRGKKMQGTATNFICCRKIPAKEILKIKNDLLHWVMLLDKESALNFLAGVIDGDGTYNPKRNALDIFTGKPKVPEAILLACLKLGILPYISVQRDSCFIIQISEKFDLIQSKLKRVKLKMHDRKYGTKLFAIRQLFSHKRDLKYPFVSKILRNTLMDGTKIENYLNQFDDQTKVAIYRITGGDLRMQRIRKIKNLGKKKEVYNITVADNHNYIVLTKTLMPILVRNCHGAGRVMSRAEAKRKVWGENVQRQLGERGILVRCESKAGIAEEAPLAYKNVDEVVEIVAQAGLAQKVAKLTPLGVIKGG